MSNKSKDLTGKRFGDLVVLGKAEEIRNRYYTWLCRCDCGNEVIFNTRDLNEHRKTHCGCKLNRLRNYHQKPKDRTGIKYGALTAIRLVDKSVAGAFLWECECECGNRRIVPATQLERYQIKDCGCGLGDKPKYKDITGRRKGQLTAVCPTDKRDGKGSVVWRCRCDCGDVIEMSESEFMFGDSISCGCIRQQRWSEFSPADYLTFVDGTCVEWIANRKSRSDNSSGFRGVYKYNDTHYRVYIGLQSKKYYLGAYKTFEEAVSVRLAVEKFLHDGFVACFEKWKEKAITDKEWASRNPFYFKVDKDQRTFRIKSVLTEQKEYRY